LDHDIYIAINFSFMHWTNYWHGSRVDEIWKMREILSRFV
jgi:hypothetical protein